MRESNFAFPAQNRACVCISSQLYDRRALDTTSPLPLFNSLTHLTYLTSTSPRIREILTMDGGLERLVRLLRDFCAHPPPPDPPALFYGLSPIPPSSSSTTTTTTTSNASTAPATATPLDLKRPFDRAAAYRFSLAFQCVVNIGVRGSEPIRARVVQAGTLDVVGCVLEAWLASRGFAVAPSQSASGMPRETREARHARRLEARARETALVDEDMLDAPDTSNDTSPSSTPRRSPTPTRERSATRERSSTLRPAIIQQPSTSSTARTDTEPESDPDADMLDASSASASASPAPQQQPQPRRTVGIVGDDAPAPLDVDMGIDMLLATDRFAALDPAAAAAAAEAAAATDAHEPREQEDRTPRAAFARLPPSDPPVQPVPQTQPVHTSSAHAHAHHHHHDAGPYREEDVLLSLQLLAYLSKYPHVRQAFYKPRASFNPALHPPVIPPPPAHKDPPTGFFKALAGAAVGRKDRDRHSLPRPGPVSPSAPSIHAPTTPSRPLTHSPNVFSLVERFTFRPSPPEAAAHNLPPLPAEIQYWAGVIMRNACRKDEARGGVRQCANMRCGRWESFPREFAKCRRCRKAKYCGKECQSRAWAEGHRFWCSAREEEGGAAGGAAGAAGAGAGAEGGEVAAAVGTSRPRGERERVRVAGAAAGAGHAMALLYGVGGEPSVYTRPRVNALAPQQTHPVVSAHGTAPAHAHTHAPHPVIPAPSAHVHPSQSQSQSSAAHRILPSLPSQASHAPYIHMGTGGPSMSTADLPGTADVAGAGAGAGRERERGRGRDDAERRRRRGAGGADDMMLG